nr:hypothetical protein [uncultured Cupriavidus sp.]
MSLLNFIKHVADSIFGLNDRASRADKVEVGTGADNEFQIYINGVPHLFRDEGDRVVHFVAEFDRQIRQTAFGNKVLPEVVPRWSKVNVYEDKGDTPQSVAEKVVREARQQSAAATPKASRVDHNPQDLSAHSVARNDRATPRAVPQAEASSSTYLVGTLVEWGEMQFPNRKPGGKPNYTSFAVKLDTDSGMKTLQGEGLKDVLAEARCEVGERVGIKRLYKEKVPAFDQSTGRQIIDKDTGKQKLWDRWVWSINRIH